MKKTYVADRVEDGIITLIPDGGGDTVELFAKDYPFIRPNDAVVSENGLFRAARDGERESKTEENRERLKRLFNKK